MKCWPIHTNKMKPVSTANVTINILICRLQLGIDRNKATTNLLRLLRPGMIRLLNYIKQSGNYPGIDMDQLLSDMQATTIEYLLYDYKIGDRGRATPYLFDPQQGFLTKWIKWVVGKNRKFYAQHELYNISDGSSSDDSENNLQLSSDINHRLSADSIYHDPYADDSQSDLTQKVTQIIEDGVTLNSNEYRVIKFCLVNSNETNATRHIDGLHIYLAKLMGVSRPRATRLYKRAREKLIEKYSAITSAESL